ncbi:hypothetical protein [Methylobacterium dankookense]|uniref:hypothetical protein n=1 Tax=Methylobacterium dankookense TaxID=560405 RepID=UPI00119CE3F9|nr:hypothetical protein [Methylobacterium dankookense]
MNNFDAIEIANHLVLQKLLANHLSASPHYATYEIAAVIITVEPSRHRTGIPAGATCLRYIITHPGELWSFVARAVWNEDRLYEPCATHVRITSYDDLSGKDDRYIPASINRWAQTLDL